MLFLKENRTKKSRYNYGDPREKHWGTLDYNVIIISVAFPLFLENIFRIYEKKNKVAWVKISSLQTKKT
jgi:hypothetical protein